MRQQDIVQAWKNPRYRNHLDTEAWALMPEHPAGSIELSDTELELVAGGDAATNMVLTAGCCDTFYICNTDGVTCLISIISPGLL